VTDRTDETIAEQFPDRGERPSDEVVVDPNADEAPDTGHPK
jgi:hypothetical protein